MSVCHKVEFSETARTAVGGILASDPCGSSKIREVWYILEDFVAPGLQALGSTITHELIKRHCRVKVVGTDSHRVGGERKNKESEDGEVFHACGWMKANWVAFV